MPEAPAEPDPHVYAPRRRTGGAAGALLSGAWWLLLAATGWATGAVAASWPLPWTALPLVALQPWTTGALLASGFALWTLLPDRPSLPVGLALGCLAAAGWWGPTFIARPDGPADGVPLRVVSWNLGKLRAPAASHPDPYACARDLLAQEAPDVAVFQEVSTPDLEALSAALDFTCMPVPYLAASPYPSANGLGVCVHARRGWQIANIAGDPLPTSNRYRTARATLTHPHSPSIDLRGVHLTSHRLLEGPAARYLTAILRFPKVFAEQTVELSHVLGSLPSQGPSIVAGDFNTTPPLLPQPPSGPRLRDTWLVGASGFGGTVDALGLPLRVDHILASPQIGVQRAWIPRVGCSDHRPILADLVMSPHTL